MVHSLVGGLYGFPERPRTNRAGVAASSSGASSCTMCSNNRFQEDNSESLHSRREDEEGCSRHCDASQLTPPPRRSPTLSWWRNTADTLQTVAGNRTFECHLQSLSSAAMNTNVTPNDRTHQRGYPANTSPGSTTASNASKPQHTLPQCPFAPLMSTRATHGNGFIFNATLFPHQIGVAATFQHMHARTVGQITALESRAAGFTWVLAPNTAVVGHLASPALYESYGPDAYLAGRMAASAVAGLRPIWPSTGVS